MFGIGRIEIDVFVDVKECSVPSRVTLCAVDMRSRLIMLVFEHDSPDNWHLVPQICISIEMIYLYLMPEITHSAER